MVLLHLVYFTTQELNYLGITLDIQIVWDDLEMTYTKKV